MKMISNLRLKVYVIVFHLLSLTAMAEDEDPGFPTEDPGAPTAPIDDWIAPMFVLGIVLVYYFFKKTTVVKCRD